MGKSKSGILAAAYVIALVFFLAGEQYVHGEFPGAQRGRKLAEVPEGYQVGQIVFSADGSRVIFSAGKNGRWHLFDGNTKGKAYDHVKMISISSDGKRVAHSATRDGREYLVIDGEEIHPYDRVCNPTFSPDGRIVVHEAWKGKKLLVTVGDKESPHHDMSLIRPVFSPDNRYVTFLMLDEKRGKTISYVSDARTGEVKKTRVFDRIGAPVFSPDGSLFAAVAERNGKRFVIVTAFQESAEKDAIGPSYDTVHTIVFSPGSDRIAHVAEKDGRQLLVVSDKEMKSLKTFGAHEKVWDPLFSPDGKAVLYAARSGNESPKWHTVSLKTEHEEKGKERSLETALKEESSRGEKAYDLIENAVFSPEGSYFAYRGVKGGQEAVVVREKTGLEYQGPGYETVKGIIPSPDGRYLAYLAEKQGKAFLVVTNREMTSQRETLPYEKVIGHRFSSDGAYLLYGAVSGREIWWMSDPVE